jgi:hypothetical protein
MDADGGQRMISSTFNPSRPMVYGPGNIPTVIPQQYSFTFNMPIVENTTENTATPEQDYTSDGKMSDNKQEFI